MRVCGRWRGAVRGGARAGRAAAAAAAVARGLARVHLHHTREKLSFEITIKGTKKLPWPVTMCLTDAAATALLVYTGRTI